MGVEGEGGNEEIGREVYEVSFRGGRKIAKIYDTGGITKGQIEGRAGCRAWRYEKRLERGGGSEWARLCWEEVRGRERKERGSRNGRRERNFFTERECRVEEIDGRKGEMTRGVGL